MKQIPCSMDKVIHFRFSSEWEMMTLLGRLDQFSEGLPGLLGQYFTHETFIKTIDLDYFDFEGVNIPPDKIEKFIKIFDGQMTDSEAGLLANIPEGFYLICDVLGCCPSVLEHELAHAQYYFDASYRTEMQTIVRAIPLEDYDSICQDLLAWGYPNDDYILEDEVHAYLKTTTDGEFLEFSLDLLTLQNYRKLFQ